MNTNQALDTKTFNSLSKVYITALGIIACLVLISQVFIQRALSNNDYDGFIINVAGKQRMLSQKISKTILLWNAPLQITRDNKKELYNDIEEWSKAHTLLKKNLESLDTKSKNKLQPYFNPVDKEIIELLAISNSIIASINTNKGPYWIKSFLLKEPSFLTNMNAYVYAYENYATVKVKRVKKLEYITFGLVIILLLFEFFFLFKPTAQKIENTLKELIKAKDNAISMADRANTAVKLKEDTLVELQILQKAINQTLLFARIDKEGVIISSGRRMQEILAKQKNIHQHIIYENLGLTENDQQQIKQQVNSQNGAIQNQEFKVSLSDTNVSWLDISIFPIIKEKGIIEYLMICVDITKRKKAQEKIDALRIEKMNTETAIQKSKASLIVEAQEEERKRIAKDIHDSIGQMLTALKFNIESLSLKEEDVNYSKINNLKSQTKDIILGVRMATFNLTPPELLHYGVITALQKMVTQLNKFSTSEILFHSEIEENLRFETLVETNLYRVTQESVNNAIKYSEASHILVNIKKTDQLLSISITDNGKGFDISNIPTKPKGGTEGGMGVFFMKERMEYINGRVFLNSTPDQGTRIVLNYPLNH